MRKLSMSLTLALAFLLVSWTAAAAETNHSIGLFVGYLSPTGDWTGGPPGVPTKVEAESATGYGLAYQYRANDLFSLGAVLLTAKHDIRLSVSGGGWTTVADATFTPILIDGNFHLLRKSEKLDFYVGPTLGYAWWGDVKPNDAGIAVGATEVPIKDVVVYGVNLGLDVPFAKQWAFNGGLRYLLAKAEIQDTGEPPNIDVNPWIVTAGASYRF